jgi:hypothetical protein
MVYVIKLRNQRSASASNVTITNTLPEGLEFMQSSPPPTNEDGKVLSYTFPTMLAGSSQLVVIQSELLPTTLPGAVLTNQTAVSDSSGNSAQASFSGVVRAGRAGSVELDVSTVRQIPAGSKLKYVLSVNNSQRTAVRDVVVTADLPLQTEFVSALPAASSSQTVDGRTRLTWNLGTINGPGRALIRVTQRVPATTPGGTVLVLSASLTDSSGRTYEKTANVTVRGRTTTSAALSLRSRGR